MTKKIEFDSNADNTVLRKSCIVVNDFDRPINITGYYPEDVSKVCRTVSGDLAYDHPHTGKPYFMVANYAIHLDHLWNNLMCTMQCMKNSIMIVETPKFQSKSLNKSTHDFQVKYPSGEEDGMSNITFQLS